MLHPRTVYLHAEGHPSFVLIRVRFKGWADLRYVAELLFNHSSAGSTDLI